MTLYEFIQNIIWLAPILILAATFTYLLRFKWYWRLVVIVLLGWVVVAGSTMLFWSYSFHYAPTDEIKMDLALRDGAPKVFATLFGWVYAFVLLVFFEAIRFICLGLRTVIRRC